MPASPFSFQYTPSGRRGKGGSFCTGRWKCRTPNLQDYFPEMQFGAVSYVRMLCGGGYHPPAQCGSTRAARRCFRRGDLWSPACPRIHQPVGRDDLGAPSACRDAPGGGPARPGHRFLSERKRWERKGRGCAPGVPPNGGSWRRLAVRTGQNRACIAARFMGSHVSGAVAPWVARIAVTPQALGTCPLYRVRPPGRRRCHASEKAWRFRRLGDAAADRMSEGRSRAVV